MKQIDLPAFIFAFVGTMLLAVFVIIPILRAYGAWAWW